MIIAIVSSFFHYCIEIIPALAVGLIISGIVHECVSDEWVVENLGGKGLRGVLFSTLVGAIVPVCCWGSLPIAVSFKKKGASLGPIFAILIATPATSVNALIVMWRFMGAAYAVFVFCAVIAMAILAGLIGNSIQIRAKEMRFSSGHTHDHSEHDHDMPHTQKTMLQHAVAILRYAFIEMPREIGVELLIGIAIAACIASIDPIGDMIQNYLTHGYDYAFAIVCGLTAYMCATMSVPLVHAFVEQGLSMGAGLTLLIIGPIASYGTILVIRKEFGWKVLVLFLFLVCACASVAGLLYQRMIM